MRGEGRTLALIFTLFASVALAAPVPKELTEKRPDYCPMTVGDKREYEQPNVPGAVAQTREITAVETKDGAKVFTQKISTGQTTVMRVDRRGVFIVSSSGTIHDPPYKACAPDMKAGDSWECGGDLGMTRTVGQSEKVVTPAGTFTAFPLTIEYTKSPGSSKQVLWYADGVGMVRYDSNGVTQLLLSKYTPGKESK